jgi:ABC-type glycerol-3-phosphate transport system substrate-binding protein
MFFCGLVSLDGNPSIKANSSEETESTNVDNNTYEAYKQKYPNFFPNLESKVDLNSSNVKFEFANDSNYDQPYDADFDGKQGLYLPEEGEATIEIDVPASGYYNIKLDYYSIEGHGANISRGLKIDGEFPFDEARDISVTRTWYDEYKISDKRENKKNDIKPATFEKHVWDNEYVLRDISGLYNDNYKFFFESGKHTLTFVPNREPVVIANLVLFNEKPLDSYETYIASKSSLKKIESGIEAIEAEEPSFKSSTILGGISDNTSSKVSPYDSKYLRLNAIGGVNYRLPGDWISWKVNVQEEGLYKITFKVLQNFNRGMFATRMLSINGEVPFEEAKYIEFPYSDDYQNITCGKDGVDFYFHLNKGENEIRLTTLTGRYASLIQKVKEVMTDMNLLYRQIVVKTGVNPDLNTEYFLDTYIPNINDRIKNAIKLLNETKQEFVKIGKNRSDKLGALDRTLVTLKKFDKDLFNVPKQLSEFKENIASLGTWVTDIKEQSLTLDMVYVHGGNETLPKAESSFFEKIWRQIVLFIQSFFTDYGLSSNATGDKGTIEVWFATGRDQAQIVRQLIDESFTAKTGINVDLKLVNNGVLLPATLADKGPDVAMAVAEDTPVNWGIRNSVYDISQFPDFEEVSKRFHPSAMAPYAFNGECYGLPETQNFLTLFYRTDILEELGVGVPRTWEDVITMLPVLQKKNLEFYMPSGGSSGILYSMIAQYGGEVYLNNGAESGLMTMEAQQAFVDYCTFFSDYGFELSASFVNRFRTGEMPIGISYYTEYNTLSVFAPEITGLWDFAPMIGHVNENGEIDNTSISATSSVIMFEDSKLKQECWEYMKWWTAADTQITYARLLEGLLGPSARYNVSNIEAFEQLPWSRKEYKILSEAMANTVHLPVVPGSYILGRYVDNAFRAVINDKVNPRMALYDNVRKINVELERKREEFGLN